MTLYWKPILLVFVLFLSNNSVCGAMENAEQDIEKDLKKISGGIVCIAIEGNKDPFIEKLASASIISQRIFKKDSEFGHEYQANEIKILTAAHVFEPISCPKEKLLSSTRFIWMFIPDLDLGFEMTVVDTLLGDINKKIDASENENKKYNKSLINIYNKDCDYYSDNQEEEYKELMEKIEKGDVLKGLNLGAIIFPSEAEKIQAYMEEINFGGFLVRKIEFPSFSRKKKGEHLWDENDDIIVATCERNHKKENVEALTSGVLKDFKSLNTRIVIENFQNLDTFMQSMSIYPLDKIIYSYGYPHYFKANNKGAVLMKGEIGKVERKEGNAFLVTLEGAGPGSSGSPIIFSHEGAMHIIGVISGDGGNGKTRASFLQHAPKISELIPSIIKPNNGD